MHNFALVLILSSAITFQFSVFLIKRCVFGSQVKLVKCLVQNIVIDISFNQMGGLCTLCFLEQVK